MSARESIEQGKEVYPNRVGLFAPRLERQSYPPPQIPEEMRGCSNCRNPADSVPAPTWDTAPVLPTTSAERKAVPLVRGLLDYFPAALVMVARVSKAGNDKHNPGQELHHARGKSNDHADAIMRHLIERGSSDPEDGLPHSAHLAWRALALLQEELEAAGAPKARGAR